MPAKTSIPVPGSRAHKRDGRLAHRLGEPPPITRPAPARGSKDFNAKELLKRTGFRVADEGKTYGSDAEKIGTTIESIGAGDLFGDLGNLVLIVVGGLLGLIFLELLLGQRGSSITSDAIKWLGSGINRVVSPTDPLTSPGASSSPNTSTQTTASSSSASGAAAVQSGAAATNTQAARNVLFVPPSTS